MKHLLHYCLAATVCLAPAGRAADQEQAKAAIAKGGEAYAKAFAAADAKALAAAYAADAEYKSLDGRVIRGREAIEAFFRGFFSDGRKRQLLVESESIAFPAPGVAVERGVTAVSEDGNTLAAQARFTNLLVEKDGQWLLASVEETPYRAMTAANWLPWPRSSANGRPTWERAAAFASGWNVRMGAASSSSNAS